MAKIMRSTNVILLIAFSPLVIQVASGKIATGGSVNAQLSEDRENDLIKYSMDAFHSQSNSVYLHKVVNVDSITSQVVNGALYKVKLEIGETDCRKGVVGQICNLKAPDGSKNLKCVFSIHEQPWLNHRSVTVKRCKVKS